MKRRHFIRGASAVAAAALWPAWLREAFADTPTTCDPKAVAKVAPDSVLDVAAAFRAATRAKQPLLVFVIPADDSEKWNRGHAFGELLNHGSDADLAPLSGCFVVCATMDALRKVVPAAGQGEPLMVLVRTTVVPATAEQFTTEMPTYSDVIGRSKRFEHRTSESSEKLITARIAALGALLRKALGSSAVNAKARAAEVRVRLRDKPPAGTHWGNSEGCGTTIEGVREQSRIGCGMGFVPEKSRRFLYFFSTSSWW